MMNKIITRGLGSDQQIPTQGYGGFAEPVHPFLSPLIVDVSVTQAGINLKGKDATITLTVS